MGRVILARHGQTNFNADGLVQGRSDKSVLNGRGRRESELLLAMLRRIAPMPGGIISSSLARSMQTGKMVADGYGMGFAQDSRLDEIGMGILEGAPYSSPGFADYDSSMRSGNLSVAEKYGVEPLGKVLARMQEFFASLSGKKKDIIAIGHGAANGIYLASLMGLGVEGYAGRQDEFSQKNCAISIIAWDGREFRLEAEFALETAEAMGSGRGKYATEA